MWKNVSTLWRQILIMLKNWEVTVPGKYLEHFRDVVLKMQVSLKEPGRQTEEAWQTEGDRSCPGSGV